MAMKIAADGEGASRLVECTVKGAKNVAIAYFEENNIPYTSEEFNTGDADLSDMVGRLCEDVDVPNYEILILDENTFENYTLIVSEN